jgi:hypothetical protein
MNYRSAVLHGPIMPFGVFDDEKGKEDVIKAEKFKLVVEAVSPGRWVNARQPNEAELKGTGLLRMLVESASAKARDGPPKDDNGDLEDLNLTSKTWTGVVPIRRKTGAPVPMPACNVAVPDHIRDLS